MHDLSDDFDAVELTEGWLQGRISWPDLPLEVQKAIEKSIDELPDDVEALPVSELLHKADATHRFTLGPWYIPNRYDAHGEWTDADELQKALWDYVKSGDRRIRLQHNKEVVAGEWVEAMSFPVPVTIGMTKDATSKQVTYPSGTVFLGVQWEPWAWEMVKAGKITGFSIGGAAARVEMGMPDENGTEVEKGWSGRIDGKVRDRLDRDALVKKNSVSVSVVERGSQTNQIMVPTDPVLFSQVSKVFEPDEWLNEYVALGGAYKFMSKAEAKLRKAQFASRSEAGRYAANVRWMSESGHTVGLGDDGYPKGGPMRNPTREVAIHVAAAFPSMKGWVDWDAVTKEFEEGGGKYGATDPKKAFEDIPYALIRKHMHPERLALHDSILEKEMAGKEPIVGRQPEFVFLGGGPAAGKSTSLRSGIAKVPSRYTEGENIGKLKMGEDAKHVIEIAPDEYKPMIPEYAMLSRGLGSDDAYRNAAAYAHEESSLLGKELQKRATAMKIDIVVDGTGDGSTEGMRQKIQRARDNGYTVRGLYSTISPQLAWERAKARGQKVGLETTISDGTVIKGEGRYMLQKTVKSIHREVSKILPELVRAGLFDSVELFETSGKDRQGKVRPPKLILRQEQGVTTFKDGIEWAWFVGKAGKGAMRGQPWQRKKK